VRNFESLIQIMTCHSERKWKEKMQEWGFEKNIPAKEMKFMATRACKRELEDGKETIFCRNGTLVDRGNVEMFKKQKLNSENSFVIQTIPGEFILEAMGYMWLTSTGTPQNISYKTPKPISSDDCHSSLSEEDIEVQKAELQRLAATVGDDPIPKDDNFSAQIEPNSMLASPVGEIEVGSEEELSEGSQYLEIPESSDLDDGHIMSGVLTPFEAISVPGPTECSSTKSISQIFHYEEEEFDTPGDLDYLRLEQLKGDMRSANQFLERGELSKAKTEYFKAVQTYINGGGGQDDPTITTSVAEIIESFKSCTEVEAPTLALLWLDLLQCLMQNFLRHSATRSLVSFELARLLVYSHQGFLSKLIKYPIERALDDLDVTKPLCSALRVSLEGSAAPQGKRSISKRFRLLLLIFMCELKKYMSGDSLYWLKSTFRDLHRAAFDLRLSGTLSELELSLLGPEATTFLSPIIEGFPEDRSSSKSAQSVEPFVTGLATGCSALGWFHEAEVLFIILRSVVKANHILSLSATRISAQYCLHLEREKRYGEILSVLNDI
jgi:hypothetical protein